jgi:hypothetical protein
VNPALSGVDRGAELGREPFPVSRTAPAESVMRGRWIAQHHGRLPATAINASSRGVLRVDLPA